MGAGRDGLPVYRVAGAAAGKAGLDALRYCGRRESEIKCWSQWAMRPGWGAGRMHLTFNEREMLPDSIGTFAVRTS